MSNDAPADLVPLDGFERAVLDVLLLGDHPVLAQLRMQVRAATVRARERNEYGQFTDLWLPAELEPIACSDRFALDDLYGRIAGCEEETAFLLHVVRGRVKTLEAFVPRPLWPQAPAALELLEWWHVAPDPDPEAAGQVSRVDERELDFALRGLQPRDEQDRGSLA